MGILSKMIYGAPKHESTGLIASLTTSNIAFHMTGSRYFGNFSRNSDYDFFCQDTNDARKFVKELCGGYRVDIVAVPNSYLDYLTTTVFRVSECTPYIDIQMVMSVKMKLVARDTIKAMGLILPHGGQSAQNCWQLAIAAAVAGMTRESFNAELFPYSTRQPDKIRTLINVWEITHERNG
jgi:hypothetical protein